MSGYLKRLVAPVVGQQLRVHPFVELIYSFGAREEAAGFMFHTETSRAGDSIAGSVSEVAPSQQPSAPSRDWEPSAQASAPAANIRAAQTGARAGFVAISPAEKGEARVETTSATVGALEPLLPRAAMHQQDAESSRLVSAREAAGASESTAASPAPASAAPRRDATPSRVWIYEPIIAEVVNAALPSSADSQAVSAEKRDPPAVPARLSPRPAFSLAAAARRAPAPRPEDIQIHIGRIEVIAVPPAAPRAVPAPVRKGLTLDEYLSGSNGRAR